MLSPGTQVLVTGANGFIGARLCEALRQSGCVVRTASRSASPGNHIVIDFSRIDSCPAELCRNIDVIFHLAGKAHALAEHQQENAEYHLINTLGTQKLLEAARQAAVKRFVFFSSVKAVGDSDHQPMDESVIAPADTPYGQSKRDAEELVLHGHYVPHAVVLRPSMVYGSTNKGNLPLMIKAIRRGLFPPLPEQGNRRSMIHVDDLICAALLAAENPAAAGQRYIVTDQQNYSTRQIYDAIRLALGKPRLNWAIPMSWLKTLANVGDFIGKLSGRRFLFDNDALQKLTGSAWYSSVKISRELGFKPCHTLYQALPDIIRSIR